VCALGDACKECDASRVRADAARRDFFTQACASSSRFKQLTDLGRMLEERKTLLCLQETDLEVRECNTHFLQEKNFVQIGVHIQL
jgi:hypothetical protein